MAIAKKAAPKERKPRFFLFSAETEQLTKKQKLLYWAWNIFCLLLFPFLICVISLKLAYGPYASDIFTDYFTRPAIIFLNYLPILLLELLLFAATGRQWIAFLATSMLIVAASIGNYYKLTLRNDPFVFSDISVVFTAFGFAGHYDIRLTPRIIAAVCAVPLGTVFLYFFVNGRLHRKPRVVIAAAVLLSLYPLWRSVYSQRSVYNAPVMENTDHIAAWSDTQQLVSRGFVYSFVYSATKVFEPMPEGYTPQAAEQALSAYTDADIPAQKQVNILAIQLEGFCDLTKLNVEGIDPEAYRVYHEIRDESYAGDLVTNIFAGGTIDTERCFVTGASALHYYENNTPSYVWYLRTQGYQTVGAHPCTQIYYDRKNVNNYLGFAQYDYLENCFASIAENGVVYDDAFFPAILEQYEDAAAQGPVFDFCVTYQGHGPYALDRLERDEVYFDGTGCSKEAYYAVNNYLSGIKNTADNIRWLLDCLEDSDIPVVVLLYGDHKPWLGNDAAYYRELGICLDPSDEEGILNYYGTEYLLWANDAARKIAGFDYRGQAPMTSSGYLMNILFNTLGWKGPAYMQFTEHLRQTMPVVTSNGLYCENGMFRYDTTGTASEALKLLLQVQYYRHRSFGKLS